MLQRSRILSHMRMLKDDDARLAVSNTLASSENMADELSLACIQRGMYVFRGSSHFSAAQ